MNSAFCIVLTFELCRNIDYSLLKISLRDDSICTLEYSIPGIGYVGDGVPGHRQELKEQDDNKSMFKVIRKCDFLEGYFGQM